MIELIEAQENILETLNIKAAKEGDIVIDYYWLLVSNEIIDWAYINQMIKDRFGIKGLERIKKLAWKKSKLKAEVKR